MQCLHFDTHIDHDDDDDVMICKKMWCAVFFFVCVCVKQVHKSERQRCALHLVDLVGMYFVYKIHFLSLLLRLYHLCSPSSLNKVDSHSVFFSAFLTLSFSFSYALSSHPVKLEAQRVSEQNFTITRNRKIVFYVFYSKFILLPCFTFHYFVKSGNNCRVEHEFLWSIHYVVFGTKKFHFFKVWKMVLAGVMSLRKKDGEYMTIIYDEVDDDDCKISWGLAINHISCTFVRDRFVYSTPPFFSLVFVLCFHFQLDKCGHNKNNCIVFKEHHLYTST